MICFSKQAIFTRPMAMLKGSTSFSKHWSILTIVAGIQFSHTETDFYDMREKSVFSLMQPGAQSCISVNFETLC